MADSFLNSAPPLVADVVTRIEKLLLAGLLVIGFGLRLVPIGGLAIEHFDEGVYASNLLFPEDGFAYPARHLYAPPLLPSVIEWSILIGGDARWVPLLPGIVLGTASIVVVWWLSRGWFGAPAAIATASLLALSDYHIAFSRSALTDVPLMFFLMLGVGWLHRGLSDAERPQLLVCGLGGIATGLAWATKYNGWLALAIGVSGAGAAGLMHRVIFQRTTRPSPMSSNSPSLRALMSGLLVAVVVAVGVWSPVLIGLHDHGGYAAVAKNHQNYVLSWSDWLPSLRRHQAVQKHFAGPVSLLGVLLAPVLAAVVLRASRSTGNDEVESALGEESVNQVSRSPWNADDDSTRPGQDSYRLPSMGVVLLTAGLTSALVLDPVIVLIVWPLTDWLARLLSDVRNIDAERRMRWPQWLGLWMCLAWIIGLALVTPLYRPYPRLLLPLCVAGWMGVGSAIVRLLSGTLAAHALSSDRPHRRRLVIVVGLLVCVQSVLMTSHKGFVGGRPRNELADVATRVLAAIRQDSLDSPTLSGVKQIVYVYAEPGLLFHLATNEILVGPVTNLGFVRPNQPGSPRLPIYLVAGPHALMSETFDRQFTAVREALQPVATVSYRPSDFVLLDDVAPSELRAARQQRVQVFRVRDLAP